MNGEFQVDDPVRIIAKPPADHREGPGWVDDMTPLCGRLYYVDRVFSDDRVWLSGTAGAFTWLTKWLEPDEPEPVDAWLDELELSP